MGKQGHRHGRDEWELEERKGEAMASFLRQEVGRRH